MPSAPSAGPVWKPRRAWERDTLGLWSAFVEQLFDGPPDDEQTWTSLHALLRDPARNLLLQPLRPARRRRDRARARLRRPALLAARVLLLEAAACRSATASARAGAPGVPPTCGPLLTNLMPRDDAQRGRRRRVRELRQPQGARGRALGDRAHAPGRLQHRSVSGRISSARRCRRARSYADPYGHVHDRRQVVRAGPRSERVRHLDGGRSAARRHGRPPALLSRLVLVRSEHEGRRRRLQAVPPAQLRPPRQRDQRARQRRARAQPATSRASAARNTRAARTTSTSAWIG